MRIAIDTNSLFTGNAGVARYTRGLLRGLGSLEPPLDLVPFAWEVPNLQYRQPARALKTLYRELIWARTTAPRRLLSLSADVYHATGSYFVAPPRAVRTVVTLHDLAVLRHPERFRAWQRRSESKRLQRLRQVDRVICISQFTANEAIALLGLRADKIDIVHNGGDFQPGEGLVPEQTPPFDVPAEFFLFVGSLEPGKNLSLLKEAYRLAREEGKTLPPLLIIGARWAGVGTEGKPPPGWRFGPSLPACAGPRLSQQIRRIRFAGRGIDGAGLPGDLFKSSQFA